MERYIIPDFMQAYYQDTDVEGKKQLENLARHYSEERAIFLQTIFVSKQQFLRDWNKLMGEKKVLTADQALAPMRHKYSEAAAEIVLNRSEEIERENQKEKEPKDDDEEDQDQLTLDLKMSREAFLANAKSIRKQSARQQARPRR
ncbi:MAG: hypothetical protein J0L80_01840 [Chitinophagales bacterium]|nr:hypothetical protein [Chitinophagales bacterium]